MPPIFTVLGAGGFLGHHLCQALSKSATVRAFGRNVDTIRDVVQCPGEFEYGPALTEAIIGADAVFHLIGTTTPAMAERDRAYDLTSNVGGTLALLELCRLHRVPRIVFASSGGTVYGVASSPPFQEGIVPSPISAYGVSKLVAEHYLRLYNHHHGMRNIVLRIANAYGPYQLGRESQGVIAAFMRALIRDEEITIWGTGSSIRDYVYVADVVDALILAAAYDGEGDLFNVGTGDGRSINDVARDIELVSGKTLRRQYVAARSFDVPVSILDITAARSRLGWHPKTTWEVGLRKTWEWNLSHRN